MTSRTPKTIIRLSKILLEYHCLYPPILGFLVVKYLQAMGTMLLFDTRAGLRLLLYHRVFNLSTRLRHTNTISLRP
jgi:hypothetical protein